MELRELYYRNSAGKIIDFMKEPYLPADISELENFYWKLLSESGRISGFAKEINSFPLTLNVYADTAERCDKAREELFELLEYDVLNNTSGRLYYNGQFVFCVRSSSTKLDWVTSAPVMKNRLEFTVEKPYWIKEVKHEFRISDILSTNNKKYPYKYPYRYANGLRNTTIVNTHFVDSNFLLRIYGSAVNPQVNIGGHSYVVYSILEEGEYLEINSIDKTVVKTMVSGNKENLFHFRGKNVFRKIPPGLQEVSFGKIDFDLVLLEERSEPRCRLRE